MSSQDKIGNNFKYLGLTGVFTLKFIAETWGHWRGLDTTSHGK
jgi:hypothetical protein